MKFRTLALRVVLPISLVLNLMPVARGQMPTDDRGVNNSLTEAQLLRLFFSKHVNELSHELGEDKKQSELFLGRLPSTLPVDLPQPPRSKIVYSQTDGQNEVMILLQVEKPLQQVQQFYQEQFRRRGWQDSSNAVEGIETSILGAISPENDLIFQNAQGTANVILNLQAQTKNSSIVWLNLSSSKGIEAYGELLMKDTIQMYALSGSLFSTFNESRLSNSTNSTPDSNSLSEIHRIETKQSLDQLQSFYNTQLQQQGWTLVSEQRHPSYLYMVWQKHLENDRVWRVNLNVVSLAKVPGQYYAYFKVADLAAVEAGNRGIFLSIPKLMLQEGETLAQLRQVAQLLLELSNSRLQMGQLPSSSPFSIPIPENAKVLGSTVSPGKRLTIVLDTLQSPEQVFAFYAEQMKSLGFRERKLLDEIYSGMNLAAFVPAQQPEILPGIFCNDARNIIAIVQASPTQTGMTAVELNLDLAPTPTSVCKASRPELPDFAQPFRQIPIPQLMPLPDAIVQSSNMSASAFGQNRQLRLNANAIIRTTQGSVELASHYFAQMQRGKWMLADSINTPSMNLSIWSLKEKSASWRAVLVFTKDAPKDEYDAILHIQQQ